MRVAEYVASRLHALGVEAGFSVVGGGAMFLNEAFGEHPGISMHYLHHEQSASMAAEGYARIADRPAAVVVTSGPGSINAMNGVFGAYTDSIPMIVVGGQVRRNTLADGAGLTDLRQLGDQEARVIAMVTPITKLATQLLDPNDAQAVVDLAWIEACGGRPGPVWIEIPVDVQGAQVDLDPLSDLPSLPEPPEVARGLVDSILDDLAAAQRPVILAGTGVRLAGQQERLLRLVEAMNVPLLTGWTHDLVPTDHALFAGRPGTIGTRAGNFVLQGCDHLLVLGSRLNIRQISYNWQSFAKNARITWVDIDAAELSKPFITPDVPVVADLRSLLPELADAAEARNVQPGHAEWIDACRHLRDTYEPTEADYSIRDSGINPYHFVMELFRAAQPGAAFVCGNASACIIPFQTAILRAGTRLFSNSGSASMGYDLPASLGAGWADPELPVVCLAGDGSLMMNVQELATLASSNLDVLVVVLDNGGYLSIKQTQTNFFGHEHGASPASGVTFPDFEVVARALGLPVAVCEQASDWRAVLAAALAGHGPRVLVARLDPEQEFEPRLKSRVIDGVITTPELDDMYPHLEDADLRRARAVALTARINQPEVEGVPS